MSQQEFKHFPAVSPQGDSLITIVSGPVIMHEGKVLLVQHGNDSFWKFPGGKMMTGSTFEETALREAREELGVEIVLKSDPAFFVFDRPFEGKKEYVVLCHFLAEVMAEPQPDSHIEKFGWHAVDALPADCAPNVPAMVTYFLHH